MDILIKGMEMPKIGYHKVYIFSDGRIEINGVVSENRIVALPEHSDLIDRDELLTDLADRMCVDDMLDGIYQPAIDRINEAKAIVEAST